MAYAIFGLAFVILVVFAILSAKSWHWLNVVLLILTFIAGLVATGALAQCLHFRWMEMKQLKTASDRLERLEDERVLAEFGSEDSLGYDSSSLRGISEELSRETIGRGRVWGGGTVATNGPNITFTYPVARDPDSPANMSNIVVFAFVDGSSEVELAGGVEELRYAVNLVGSFKVVSESPESIELEEVFVSNREALTALATTTWTLYEKMPVDRSDSFRKVANIAEDASIAEYREVLETQFLRPEQLGLPADSAEYEMLIDQYAFDGQTIGDIENYIASATGRKNTRFQPRPEDTFTLYRFTENVSEADGFHVDGTDTERLDQSGTFNERGLAIDRSLHWGSKVGFAKDDTVLIDGRTVEGYQQGDVRIDRFDRRYPVELQSTYYYRPLNNFPYQLDQLQRLSRELVEIDQRLKTENQRTDLAVGSSQEQVEIRDGKISALRDDQTGLIADVELIDQLNEKRTRELEKVRARIAELDGIIEQSYRELGGTQ